MLYSSLASIAFWVEISNAKVGQFSQPIYVNKMTVHFLALPESFSFCEQHVMQGVGSRMRKALEARGFSETAMAKRLDLAKSTFNNHLNDRAEPKFETLLLFCELTGVEIGDILRAGADDHINFKLDETNDDFVKIDVFDIALAAGDGRTGGQEIAVDQLAFRKLWLSRNGIDPAHASIVRVEGKSMEPALQNGSIVLIDHRHQTPLLRSHIYAVRDGNCLLVKRVERSSEDQSLMLFSDNPEYPTKHYVAGVLQDFAIIGRVVWSARTWPA